MTRTILLLSAKRSGSTAIFRMFQNHPAVAVPHPNQAIERYEPNFWNFAARAIAGDSEPFRERFPANHPVIRGRVPDSDAEAFSMWDDMHASFGPILFDKSPRMLVETEGIDLVLRYQQTGRDVRLISLIRDPRDVIASQFERWSHVVENDSPQRREVAWVAAYSHLLELRRRMPIPLFRYEDLAAHPACYASAMLAWGGLSDLPECYRHIRPVSIGRHLSSPREEIQTWRLGTEIRRLMGVFGYKIDSEEPVQCHARATI